MTQGAVSGGARLERLEGRRMMSLTVGPETTVSGLDGAARFDLAVAGNGSFIVVGDPPDGGGQSTLTAVLLSASAQPIGDPIEIDDDFAANFDPPISVSIDADGDAVVAYLRNADQVYVSRISKTGVASAPVLVASAGADQNLASPSISMDAAGGYFVGWIVKAEGDVDSGDSIRMRAFNADGAPRAAAFTAAEASSYGATLSALDLAARPDGGGAVFAYTETPWDFGSDVRVGRVSTSARVGMLGAASGFYMNLPDVAVRPDGSSLVAYQNSPPFGAAPGSEARARLFDAAGAPLDRQVLLFPANHGDDVFDDSAAPAVDVLPDGGFLATFVYGVQGDGADDDRSIVFAQFVGPDGAVDFDAAIELDRQSTDDDALAIAPAIGTAADGSAVVGYLDTATNTVRFRRLSDEFAELRGSDLYVFGTAADDVIDVYVNGTEVEVRRGQETRLFDVSDVTMLSVRGLGGNDSIINRTSFPATISGDDGDDTIVGGSGNDKLRGLAGRDWISGGGGNDRIYGDDGVDSLFGNGGRDYLQGGANADHIRGNAGRDKLFGGGGDDRLFGGSAGDWLFGGDHDDQLFGEGGDDRLTGDAGADTLRGGAGNDVLTANDGRPDHLFGDGGRDSATSDDADLLASVEALLRL